jgi:hypothetical protein
MGESIRARRCAGHSRSVKITIGASAAVKMPMIKVTIKMTTTAVNANTQPDHPKIAVADAR